MIIPEGFEHQVKSRRLIEAENDGRLADIYDRDHAADTAVIDIEARGGVQFRRSNSRFYRLIGFRQLAGVGLSPAEYAAAFFPKEGGA